MEIYLITGSIRDLIRRYRLPLTDLPGLARRHGFEGIEISDRQVGGVNEAVLARLKGECVRRNLGIILDVGCDLTLPSGRLLKDQIAHAAAMTRAAKTLGARGIRIWLGGQMLSIQRLVGGSRGPALGAEGSRTPGKGFRARVKRLLTARAVTGTAHEIRAHLPQPRFGVQEKKRRAAAALKQIVEDPAAEGLFFAVENHWGISARPETLMAVIDAVGSDRLGTCPDFANFPKGVNRYEALRRLASRAFVAHAKFMTRGPVRQREVDFRRCLAVLKESAFDGILAVEHDGPGDGLERCLTLQRMIREFW